MSRNNNTKGIAHIYALPGLLVGGLLGFSIPIIYAFFVCFGDGCGGGASVSIVYTIVSAAAPVTAVIGGIFGGLFGFFME